jgi:hypothetical protein
MDLENYNINAKPERNDQAQESDAKLHDDWFDTQTGKDAPGAEGENGESKEDGSPGEGVGVLEEIPGLPDVQFDGPSIEFKGCGELKIKR